MHGQRHLHRPDKGGPVSDRRPRRTRRTRPRDPSPDPQARNRHFQVMARIQFGLLLRQLAAAQRPTSPQPILLTTNQVGGRPTIAAPKGSPDASRRPPPQNARQLRPREKTKAKDGPRSTSGDRPDQTRGSIVKCRHARTEGSGSHVSDARDHNRPHVGKSEPATSTTFRPNPRQASGELCPDDGTR